MNGASEFEGWDHGLLQLDCVDVHLAYVEFEM